MCINGCKRIKTTPLEISKQFKRLEKYKREELMNPNVAIKSVVRYEDCEWCFEKFENGEEIRYVDYDLEHVVLIHKSEVRIITKGELLKFIEELVSIKEPVTGELDYKDE